MKGRRKVFLWTALASVLLNSFSACAETAANPYGAGLDGYNVPPAAVPQKRILLTDLSLNHPVDLSDTFAADDAPAIAEGLNAVEPGDALVLPDGVYNLKSAVVLQSGKSLIGQSRDGVVLKMEEGAAGAVIKGDRAEGLRIESLTLTSGRQGEYPTDPAVNHPQRGSLQYGVVLYGCKQVSLKTVRTENFRIAGVALNSSAECRIEGNLFSHATDVGPGGNGYGVLLQAWKEEDGAHHNIVANNRMEGPHLRHGILLQAKTHHNLITENELSGILLDAIDLHGMGEYQNEISFNRIVEGGESGIGVGNGPMGQHGASGEKNYVHHNEMVGCVYGVTVMMGTPSAVIEKNRILKSERCGIRLWHSRDTIIEGNEIGETAIGVSFQKDGVDGGLPQTVRLTENRFHNVQDAVFLQMPAVTEQLFSLWSGNINPGGALLCVGGNPQEGKRQMTVLGAYKDEILQESAVTETAAELRLTNPLFDRVRIFIWAADTLTPEKNIIIIDSRRAKK